ncbi:PGPGW domain-containing protein [Microcella sp.]|uniref:PGPGW domain-containing protein n=1 Tax=Microcella sp. TaxID=1913979 RepID=UPI0025F729A7|nr:PGPGW domain-containing protein [Microcella sp.]
MSTHDPRILQPGDAGYEAAGAATRITKPRSAAASAREAIRRRPKLDRAYRTGVKVVGGTTVGLGVVLMPLPGPGTLIALGGLAILGTESERAKKLNRQGVDLATRAAATAKAAREKRAARKDAPQA